MKLDDIFYANIVFEANGQTYNLDSRPSDAIAIAVRARVPILVNTDVMDEAGVTPEADLNTQSKPSSEDDVTNISQRRSEKTETKPAEVDQDDLGRLSIFEDFLSKLDKPDANEGDKPKP